MDRTRKSVLFLGLLVVMLLGLSLTAVAVPAETVSVSDAQAEQLFPDVGANNKNMVFINYLANEGILNGFPDGTYKPTQGLNRAQAATVIVRAADLDTGGINKVIFSDVAAEHWAAANIAAAAEAGYIKGFPDGTFRPEEQLTRAQGISLVLRLSKQDDTAQLPLLRDMNTSHWAAGPMAVGLAAEMIGLSSDGKQVFPEAVYTRGSLARALGTLLTRDPDLYQETLEGSLQVEEGTITLIRQGKTKSISNEIAVQAGDIIRTGRNSSANLVYADGSSILIKENTEIEVAEALGRAYLKADGTPGIAVDWLNLDMKKGTVFGALATRHNTASGQEVQKIAQQEEYLLASLDGNNFLADAQSNQELPWWQAAKVKKVKMQVDMPWGVAAIRGTFVRIMVDDDGKCDVSCLTGDAEVSSKNEQGEITETVSLQEGQATGVSEEAATPEPPAPMTSQEMNEFSREQQWIENTAQNMDANQEVEDTPAPPAEEEIVQENLPEQPATEYPATEQPPSSALDTVRDALGDNGSDSDPGAGSSGGISGGSSDDDDDTYIVSLTDISDTAVEGEAYELPLTVPATMNNGTTRNIPVSWNVSNPDTSVVRVVTITGTVPGFSGTVTLTLSIEEAPVVIESIADISKIVLVGEEYSLPLTVTAQMTDGSSQEQEVSWTPATVDTSTPGEQTFTGTVAGYSGSVTLTLIVQTVGIESIEDIALTINIGDVYSLPSMVSAQMTDGSTQNLDVSWTPATVDTSSAGEFTFSGTVAGYEGTVNLYLTISEENPPYDLTLTVGTVTSDSVELILSAQDDTGIDSYEIYRDGELLTVVDTGSYTDLNLETGAEYSYQIKAIDIFDNVSEISEALVVTVLSNEKEILSFALAEQIEEALINSEQRTVEISVEQETDLTQLVPEISVSEGASIDPASGVSRDFSSAAVYTVTAADESQANWTVTVNIEQSSDADLQSLTINAYDAEGASLDEIALNEDFAADTTSYTASADTNVSSISLTISASDIEAIIELNGEAVESGVESELIALQEGDNTLTIVVTAEDSTTKTYNVNISVEEANIEIRYTETVNVSGTSFGTVSIDNLAGVNGASTFTVDYLVSGESLTTAPVSIDSPSESIVYNSSVTIKIYDASDVLLYTFPGELLVLE